MAATAQDRGSRWPGTWRPLLRIKSIFAENHGGRFSGSWRLMLRIMAATALYHVGYCSGPWRPFLRTSSCGLKSNALLVTSIACNWWPYYFAISTVIANWWRTCYNQSWESCWRPHVHHSNMCGTFLTANFFAPCHKIQVWSTQLAGQAEYIWNYVCICRFWQLIEIVNVE